MKKNIVFLVMAVFILIFCGTYIYALHSPGYNVTDIQISGNSKITSGEIKNKAQWCMGKNIFSLNLKRIEEKLTEDVRLRQVRVKKIHPSSIWIEVEEKTPVLWISLPNGFLNQSDYGFYGLSIDQEIIPLDKSDLSHDLPMVNGLKEEQVEEKSLGSLKPYQRWLNFKVEKALEFYTMLLENDSSSLELLAEINLADSPNLILYLLPYGNKVLLGAGDYEKKWRRLKTILSAEKKIEEVLCMDLRFDDQVVLTRSSDILTSSDTDSSSRSLDKKGQKPRKGSRSRIKEQGTRVKDG